MRFLIQAGVTALATAALVSADVTYQETTKFKGGALIDMVQKMASMPMMGRMMGGNGMKQAFQDQAYQVYIKGNKMAHVGATMSTIYDLDAGTVTQINHEKQSYTVQTFEELRQRMEEMQQRASRGGQGGGDIQFDMKVEKTGQTRQVDGQTAKETVLKMTAKQATEQGQMVVTVHAWLAPITPLEKEAQEFHKKLAEKMVGGMGGLSPMMGGANAGLAAAVKEMSKMDGGYPVLSESVITGVTGVGGPMAAMSGGGGIDPNTPLIDTETATSGFAKGVMDESKLTVPAGYKEEKARGRR